MVIVGQTATDKPMRPKNISVCAWYTTLVRENERMMGNRRWGNDDDYVTKCKPRRAVHEPMSENVTRDRTKLYDFGATELIK